MKVPNLLCRDRKQGAAKRVLAIFFGFVFYFLWTTAFYFWRAGNAARLFEKWIYCKDLVSFKAAVSFDQGHWGLWNVCSYKGNLILFYLYWLPPPIAASLFSLKLRSSIKLITFLLQKKENFENLFEWQALFLSHLFVPSNPQTNQVLSHSLSLSQRL